MARIITALLLASTHTRAAPQLQRLPQNTGMSLVAHVTSVSVANDTFWQEQCTSIPSKAIFITVDMGGIRDFFRPIEGASYCEMLVSSNKHEWSFDGLNWKTPKYSSQNNGGYVIHICY